MMSAKATTCRHCGGPLQGPHQDTYCSVLCACRARALSRRKPKEHTHCVICGQELAKQQKQYCSIRCFGSTRQVPMAVGDKLGRLTVVELPPVGQKRPMCRCLCDCGAEVSVRKDGLLRGSTRSCGCLQVDVQRERQYKHGLSRSREKECFYNAKARCTNPDHISYANYGGRGIEFRFETFEDFYAELGSKPSPEHTINRIDNDGHYEPGNVEWATRDEQKMNQRPRRWRKRPR